MTRAVLLAFVSLGLVLVPVSPAAGHARVVGTDPADGAVVDAPVTSVVLYLDSKPATAEGDPLRVFSPSGTRVDTGPVRILDSGEALAVDLPPEARFLDGDYHVVYSVISEDSHLIAGRFSFTSEHAGPDPSVMEQTSRTPRQMVERCAVTCRNWPQAAGSTAVGVGVTVLSIRRSRRVRREAAFQSAVLENRAREHARPYRNLDLR